MNEKDRTIVTTLKHQLSTFVHGDYFGDYECLKWLQQNKYNVETTTFQLREYYRLINSYNFSKKPKYHEIMNKYWPYGVVNILGKGKDSDYFVYIETLGNMDAEGILKSVPKAHICLNRLFLAESGVNYIRNLERESDRRIDVIFIHDMEGKKTANKIAMYTGPYMMFVNTMIKYYDVCHTKHIIINVPNTSSIIYNIVKPLLPDRTKKKVIVLGSNWKTKILQHVDPNVLPVHYGGNLTENGDPKCPNQIVYTTDVPLSFYWSPLPDDSKLDQLTVLTVHAGSFKFVTIEIKQFGSVLEWFYRADGDWGFGVFFTETESDTNIDNMVMIYPQLDRLSGPSVVTEHDKIECPKCGFYKIWFNNSFSWLSKVNINYMINVIMPNR